MTGDASTVHSDLLLNFSGQPALVFNLPSSKLVIFDESFLGEQTFL